MQENKISVFVGFTPYHAHLAAQIIEQTDGAIYCIFSKIWPDTAKHYTRFGGNSPTPGAINLIISLIRFSIFIHLSSRRKTLVDIYIPHPGHIFTNYLFHTEKLRKRLFIYEDGLLNYVDTNSKSLFVTRLKRLLSYIVGLPYTDYSGHTAGYDIRCYDGAFLTMPERAVRKDRLGKIHNLNTARPPISTIARRILFLDQDVSGYITETNRQECIERMLNTYPLGTFEYHYKPHHDFKSKISDLMTPLSPAISAYPAEVLIDRIRPSLVISFFSSALINIKHGWPEIECVSLAADQVRITRDSVPTTLRELFQDVGVRCL
ncbi:polysialyltransferase family glycosyltransferase [Thauera phenolivorans]|uniref:polysialyltransferase family glycosyltransferase n=1 Tax=Thauera phenolivorans TaxID=1792543 RepID=UPI001300F643|nr:polysialyltransferase family glycosyltransferase [Thauera phenolivorans]